MHHVEIVSIFYLSRVTEMVYFLLWGFDPVVYLLQKKIPNHKMPIYLYWYAITVIHLQISIDMNSHDKELSAKPFLVDFFKKNEKLAWVILKYKCSSTIQNFFLILNGIFLQHSVFGCYNYVCIFSLHTVNLFKFSSKCIYKLDIII